MALAVAIIASSLALWYWDVQDIHRAWCRSGDTLGMSTSLPWKQSGVQKVDLEGRWDSLFSNEHSNPLRRYAKETDQNN